MGKIDLMKEFDFSRAKVICNETNNPPSQLISGKLMIEILVPGYGPTHLIIRNGDYDRFVAKEDLEKKSIQLEYVSCRMKDHL